MTTLALKIGQNVKTNTKEPHQGVLRFIGTIDGNSTTFCGIELQDASGKNDGSVKGKHYFECPPGHGIFVKRELVTAIAPSKPVSKRASVLPATTSATRTPTSSSSTRGTTTTTPAKRLSVAPTPRSAAARQSIAATPPITRRTPTTSRPSSQIISQDVVAKRLSRMSTQSIPREPSPVKQSPVDKPHSQDEDADSAEEATGRGSDDESEDDKSTAPGGINDQPLPSHILRSNMGPPPPPHKPSLDHAALMAANDASRELEQLKVKYHAMEKKRIEDRDTIKQVDTLKSENERLTNIINAMSSKMRKVSGEKQLAEARIQQLEQQAPTEPERPAQLESELELATLDKEMAEERADALEHELSELKARYEELELETDIIREENQELNSSMTDEEKAGAGWMHLERERDRLREALILLRDHKQEKELDLKEELENLRSDLSELEETASKYHDAAEQLRRLEDTTQHLREQLEAAENQEDVISAMMSERDRHLIQIEGLRASLSELEELAQTNEDLERLYMDNEKGLLSKLDEQEAMLVERDRDDTQKDKTIEDLEFTLNKFRSVMQGLQGDIDEARRSREISEIQASEMNSRSRAMMETNIKLQSNAAKSQTKQIDLEMLKAQSSLSASHSNILSLFLPETFDAERTPIQALLSFGLLKRKAALVAVVLAERLRNNGQLESDEDVLSGYKIVRSMQWISQSADRFERFMSTCSPSEFTGFSHVGQEIEPVDRAVTHWLEALKSDKLRADSPDHMQRMQSILADVADKLLPSTAEVKVTQLISESSNVASCSENAASLFDWLARAVKIKLGGPTDDDSQSIELDRKVEHLGRLARSVRNASGKVTGELEKRRNKSTGLDETAWPLFETAEQNAFALSDRVHQLCQIILDYLNEVEQDERPSYETLLNLLKDDGNDILSTLLTDLKGLYEQIQSLDIKASDSSCLVPFEPKTAPWVVRSKELKSQRLVSAETQEELALFARRNQELSMRVAEKERIIEEVTIRAALAEKRVKENKLREGQEKALKDELEQYRADKAALATQLSDVRAILLALQAESGKEKEELVLLRTQTADGKPNGGHALAGTTAAGSTISEQMSIHIKALLAEIRDLEATVRHLRWENRELSIPISETKFAAVSQTWLDPASLQPQKVKHRQKRGRTETEQSRVFDTLLGLSSSKSMKPVRLKHTWPKNDEWRSAKASTKWQVLRQKEELESLESFRNLSVDSFVVRVR